MKDINTNFADRVVAAVQRTGSAVVVGLDPHLESLPDEYTASFQGIVGQDGLQRAADAVLDFNTKVIDAIADVVPAVKPQAAFYERLGSPGVIALQKTIHYARARGLLVIVDAKRNDIESTAAAYADAYLGRTCLPGDTRGEAAFQADAITVTPYLGADGIEPFVRICKHFGGGIFVLVRTSNPSSSEFQGLRVYGEDGAQMTLAQMVASKVHHWGASVVGNSGLSSVGAVVGATFPNDVKELRALMPRAIFLVPGIGVQGGDPGCLTVYFNPDGLGALVAASRSIIYAYRSGMWAGLPFPEAARAAAVELGRVVNRVKNGV